jgi:oligopeptide/dipeptide ABC transporter ATP-binding protein
VPRLDATQKRKLEPIEGQPPDLGADTPGCRFLPRCRFGDAQTCGRSFPPLAEVAPGHWSACFKAEEVHASGRKAAV